MWYNTNTVSTPYELHTNTYPYTTMVGDDTAMVWMRDYFSWKLTGKLNCTRAGFPLCLPGIQRGI